MADISYELPLNERIRTLIRLEHLFQQTAHTRRGASAWDSRLTMTGLIDILQIASRSDLKTELIKELERLSVTLRPLQSKQDIDHKKLGYILDEIDDTENRLHNLSGLLCQSLRDNEFIASIRQRQSVPGGTCDVDLPAFHCWLQLAEEDRLADFDRWFAELDLLCSAVTLILRLVRQSAVPTRASAERGFFQQSLDTATPYQMVRVSISEDSDVFAEISGGKHRFTIRFLKLQTNGRPVQTEENIDFQLCMCVI